MEGPDAMTSPLDRVGGGHAVRRAVNMFRVLVDGDPVAGPVFHDAWLLREPHRDDHFGREDRRRRESEFVSHLTTALIYLLSDGQQGHLPNLGAVHAPYHITPEQYMRTSSLLQLAMWYDNWPCDVIASCAASLVKVMNVILAKKYQRPE